MIRRSSTRGCFGGWEGQCLDGTLGEDLAMSAGVERMVGRKSKNTPSSVSVPVKLLITSRGPTLMTSLDPSFYLSVPSTEEFEMFLRPEL